MITKGVGWYGIGRALCKYELGCCQPAVGRGPNPIMVEVPVCAKHLMVRERPALPVREA